MVGYTIRSALQRSGNSSMTPRPWSMDWRAQTGHNRKEVTLGDSADQQSSRGRVAIIGSGPGALVAARYLKQHGFEPVVFEQDHEIGGHFLPCMLDARATPLTCARLVGTAKIIRKRCLVTS
jgi:NADPH-dependent 2,4-dienoyl-CoA reductase/sulfur reductase-like enzyme